MDSLSYEAMNNWWQDIVSNGAVWQHSGDPRAPHVVLRGGKHSDGFIDALQYISLVEKLIDSAVILSDLIKARIGKQKIDWVFGSPMAGIPLATIVACQIYADRVGFTEKVGDKELICRYDLPVGAKVLLIEEMTTTGGTPQRGIDAILTRNPKAEILPYVGALLTRCNDNPIELHSASLISIVSLPKLGIHFHEWDASECPLCQKGSQAISNCKRVWNQLLQTITDPTYSIRF